MAINPFTQEEFNHYNKGARNKFPFHLILIALAIMAAVALILYIPQMFNSGVAQLQRNSLTAYFIGNPWSGKLAYQYYDTEDNVRMNNYFGIIDVSTAKHIPFAKFSTDSDPIYAYYSIIGDSLVLWDYGNYFITYSISELLDSIDSKEGKEIKTKQMFELPAAISSTMFNHDSIKKYISNSYLYQNEFRNVKGMGKSGMGKKELDGPQIKRLGLTDFNAHGLKYSYWVYDVYANQEVKHSKTQANLVLVVMDNLDNDKTATSFFALVDRTNMKALNSGYPNHTIQSKDYIDDYFLNCMRIDEDYLLVLTRDKVLKVSISNCEVETVASY